MRFLANGESNVAFFIVRFQDQYGMIKMIGLLQLCWSVIAFVSAYSSIATNFFMTEGEGEQNCLFRSDSKT